MAARFSAPVQTGPGAQTASCTMGTGSFPGVKSGRGVTLTPQPPSSAVGHERVEYTSTPPMGRTACTEPQCLYKGALVLFYFYWLHVCPSAWNDSATTGRIFIKFDILVFFESVEHIQVELRSEKNYGYFI